MAGLGQLVVSLTAETAQFRQAMDRAAYQSQKNFQTITTAAKTAGGILAGVFAIRGVQGFIQEQLNAADALLKLSQRVNVSVEDLSRLQNAAELAGVSSGELEQSLVRFSASIGKAANGSKSLADTFGSLGISVKDSNGVLRPTQEILFDLADEFARTEDGARKLAIAQELGSRGFEKLIPLLNQGSEGLKKYSATFSDDFAKNAEAFNDNITELRQNFSRLAATIAGPLVAALNEAFGTPVGKDLDAAIERTKQRIDDLKDSIQQTQLFGKEGLFGGPQEAIAKFQANLILAEGELARLEARRDSFNKKGKETLAGDEEEAKKKEKVSDILKKQVDAYNALVLSKEELLLIDAASAGATEEQIAQLQRVNDAIKERTKAQEQLKTDQDELKRLYEQTRTPVQALADKEAELLALRERLVTAGEDVARVDRIIAEARLNLSEQMDKVKTSTIEANKTALAFGDAFSSAFENAILSGNNLRGVLQGLLQDIIKIALRTAITEPLGKAIAAAIPSFSFGGGKALGGPVIGGTSYLVGEKGPEVFTAPPGGGQIIPNSAMGNNVVVNQSFNISAGVSQTVRAEISNLMPRIMEATKAAVVDSRRRGGTFSKAFS